MADPALKERPKATAHGRARPASEYEADFYAWAVEQTSLLRSGQFGELDIENLAEELQSLGNSEFSKLRSAVRIIVMHMLKWDHQPMLRSKSWAQSIRIQRTHYDDAISTSPSLIRRRDEALLRAYRTAREWAASEAEIPEDEFPDTCPYTWDDILTRPFEAEPAPE